MVNLISGPGRPEGYREIKRVTQTSVAPASVAPTPPPQLVPVVSCEVSFGQRWRRQKPKSGSQMGHLAVLMCAPTAQLSHFRPLSGAHARWQGGEILPAGRFLRSALGQALWRKKEPMVETLWQWQMATLVSLGPERNKIGKLEMKKSRRYTAGFKGMDT